jgi:hypothetical protein
VARDDHEHHPDREDQDVGVAVEQVHHVAGREGLAAGLPLKEHDECDQGEDHPELAGVPAEDLFECFHGVFPRATVRQFSCWRS